MYFELPPSLGNVLTVGPEPLKEILMEMSEYDEIGKEAQWGALDLEEAPVACRDSGKEDFQYV